jgi:hypothetical protein
MAGRKKKPPKAKLSGWAAAERVATTFDVESRATYLGDPVLGGGLPVDLGEAPAMREQVPVMLLEPRETLAIEQADGSYREGQVEAIIKAGMSRFTWPAAQVRSVTGWSLRRTKDDVELWDQGGLWARAHLGLEPEWVSAAVSLGSALVLYSPWLGVRIPPNHRGEYTVEQRRQELVRARQHGLVAIAFVPWRVGGSA